MISSFASFHIVTSFSNSEKLNFYYFQFVLFIWSFSCTESLFPSTSTLQECLLPIPFRHQTSEWATEIRCRSALPLSALTHGLPPYHSGSDPLSRAVTTFSLLCPTPSHLDLPPSLFLVWSFQEGKRIITFIWYFICSLWNRWSYCHFL